jgi:hypothetical protein
MLRRTIQPDPLVELDRVARNWQILVDRGELHEGQFLYKYVDNVLRYALYVSDPKTSKNAAWDKAVVLFCQSLVNLCGARAFHLFRGNGFDEAGTLNFSFDDWNFPSPPERALRLRAPPSTTASGLQLFLLKFFIKLIIADGKDVPAIVRSDNFKLYPVNLLRDGTAISAGCEPNLSTRTIDGANVPIDLDFIKNNPRPSPYLVSRILFTEAIAIIFMTACGRRFFPAGLEFAVKSSNAEDVFQKVSSFARQAQICLHCLETKVKAEKLVMTEKCLSDSVCDTLCNGQHDVV